MDRRTFRATVSGRLLAAPLAAQAQQARKVWRIGLLDYGAASPSSVARWKAFREQLRELGYVEGQNVAFEARWADGEASSLPKLVAELISRNVDVVVTVGTEAAHAAKQAASSIPIVTAATSDPVVLGLVKSLARPGGHITGVSSQTGDLVGKRVELLKQLVPRASRVAILRDPDSRGSLLQARSAESTAKALGVVVQSFDARDDPRELDAVFTAMGRAHVDGTILVVNTAFIGQRRRIAELAISHRLPLMSPAKEYAEAGALVSYGTNYPEQFRRAAIYVDKILNGAKPADLPIEQPTKFELIINLKTAKALGLTIPQSLLLRADEVIQ